jgi:hypothetical protein
MAVFDVAGMLQVAMGQKHRFGLAGCTGSKVQGGAIIEIGGFRQRLIGSAGYKLGVLLGILGS